MTMVDPVPTDETTLAETRAWLREQLSDGTSCPVCTQHVEMYSTPLPGCAARLLIAMWVTGHGERKWYYVPGFNEKGGDPLKARHWGLIEARPDLTRDDGSVRTGWWRLTLQGTLFVQRRISVPLRAKLFNAKCWGYEGDNVFIDQRVGKGFDYRELMGRWDTDD